MSKKIIIAILLVIFIVIGSFVYLFIDSIKEDQQITKEKAKEIISAYEKFDSNIHAFAALREEYYTSRENTFLEEFSENTKSWDDLISRYEKSVKDIENSSKILKDSCKVKFADVRVSTKCTNFTANYEAAMNYYLTDIKGYNKTVEEYNKWANENGKNKLNEGKFPVYKDYIDFDKDGEYFGKEEVSKQ